LSFAALGYGPLIYWEWTSPEKVEGFSDRFCESEELQ
jgi:hypothetical protein